jgi:hypothetical protein
MTGVKKGNENRIVWGPVPQTGGVFTSVSSASNFHGVYATVVPRIRPLAEPPSAAFDLSASHYSDMMKMAKKFMPDQSWFDEDFSSLRHPR